jgi:CRISPR type III-B/RAMP module RAMP protein Cmr1
MMTRYPSSFVVRRSSDQEKQMNPTLKLEMQVLTPLFLAGAEARGAPEWRVPSLRGALRYWLRAALAGVLGDRDLDALQRAEAQVFGSTHHASNVTLRIESPPFQPVPLTRQRAVSSGKRMKPTGRDYLWWSMAQNKKRPTLSAGIAFAHHQTPLSGALQVAHAALERAKEFYGRDALCVAALKRSGEHIEVGAHWDWGTLDEARFVVSDIAEKFRGTPAPLSSRLAFDLAGESRALGNPNDAYAARVHWLVQRHTQNQLLSEDEQGALADRIVQMARALDNFFAERFKDDAERPRGTSEMARWILVARFLAQTGGD